MCIQTFVEDMDPKAKELLAQCSTRQIKKGKVLIYPGHPCQGYTLVLTGVIRVFMVGENGREMTLYRVYSNESCILSTSCLFTDDLFPAEAVTEEDCEILVIPMDLFQTLLHSSKAFRTHVFACFNERISQIMGVVDKLAFVGVEQRLARYLLKREQASEVTGTHEAIAYELGSAREVISRYLKRFEKKGLIAPGRGKITLVDKVGLSELANH